MKCKNIQNPFVFGGTVAGSDFCGREKELAELKKDALSGQNVLVFASRRYGKTSMLEVFREARKKEGLKCMYVDVSRALDTPQFVDEYFNAFARELGGVERAIETIKNKLGFGLSFSIKQPGSPMDFAYSLDVGVKEKQVSLEQVMTLPFSYAKKEKELFIVIIDEFQETAKLGIEAKLRSIFQTHGRNVAYLFAGSKKSILLQMFGDKGRPFYQSVKTMHLGGIPIREWRGFISDRFALAGKKISNELISKIVTLADGCPYLVQHLCYVLWDIATGTIKDDDLNKALDVVLAREDYQYGMSWDMLSLTQQKMALILAGEPEELYAKDTLTQYGMVASAAQKALAGLWMKDVADRIEGGKHTFQDPFFKLWLLRNKGAR
ncbi:MAG: hypothetical protein ACD_74C00137G0006 [uncultured bacterium]|nr:MAG: hypothetical protein ACD_74C00137G0006 [uncultured bacterium]